MTSLSSSSCDPFLVLASKGYQPPLVRAAQMSAALATLTEHNPLTLLSQEDYRALLRLVVEAERVSRGGLRTKTTIELAAWLDVLDGGRSREAFLARHGERLWDWAALAELRLSGIVAFCYMRMVRDARDAG